jgi:protease III
LLKRYQEFYPIMLSKLEALSENDIEQYKKAILEELTMPPQTLDEELSRYMPDYRLSRFAFDSRSKKIAKVKNINKQDLIDFYRYSIINQKGLVLASQVLGKRSDDIKQPNAISEFTEFENASALQDILLK